jgi:hypothetical protein
MRIGKIREATDQFKPVASMAPLIGLDSALGTDGRDTSGFTLNTYTVAIKSPGDSAMKPILLSNCNDLCRPIHLECSAAVVAHPYFLTPSAINIGTAPAPMVPLAYQRADTGVHVIVLPSGHD